MYDDENAGLEQETALVKAAPLPLAWHRNGQRFAVPQNAKAWRVLRKRDSRGRPSVVSTPKGPLHIDIDADFEMLSEAVGHQPGWYVLHAVGENGLVIQNCPAAYVEVVPELGPGIEQPDTVDRLCTTVQQMMLYSVQRDEALCQALGQMTSSLSEIQKSTAEMVRAAANGMAIASGAELPKAQPVAPLPPPPPPPKSFTDFLMSPTGLAAVNAVKDVLNNLTGGGNK